MVNVAVSLAMMYAKKYHKYSYICNKLLMGVNENHVDTSEQENDDDCDVSLLGEDDDNNINNDDSFAESSDDESEDRPHKKQHIKAV